MPPTATAVLTAAAPWLHRTLPAIPDMGFAAQLPAVFNWMGFEFRLAAGDKRVDFGLCCEQEPGDRAKLKTWCDAGGDLAFAGPMAPALRNWLDPASLMHQLGPVIWLEWDLSSADPGPFSFACVDPGFPTGSAPPLPVDQFLALCAETVQALSGRPATPAQLQALAQAHATLPETGRILHLAAVPHRDTAELRVHAQLPTHLLLPWLQQIGWPGDPADAAAMQALIGPDLPTVGVQWAIVGGVTAYLGLEAYSLELPTPGGYWHRFFDRLVGGGLADPARSLATLQWFGAETVRLPGEPFRCNLQRKFYVKLVSKPRQPLEAKAYLTLHPRFVLL